mgnify:CR=1 FL=1
MGVSVTLKTSVGMVDDAFDGEFEKVKCYIEKGGYDIESMNSDKSTALSEASVEGHDQIVEFLINEGADPNSLNKQNRSPLWRAAYKNR